MNNDIKKPLWELCELCKDYVCNHCPGNDQEPILHIADCDCPDLEKFFSVYEIDPLYTTVEQYRKILEKRKGGEV